jgi:hypothetical protein
VFWIALPFYVHEQTGSWSATGAMFFVETLPPILLGSLAGVYVDRWDQKQTLVTTDLARALVFLLLLVAGSPKWLWVIYPITFVEAGGLYLLSGGVAAVVLKEYLNEEYAQLARQATAALCRKHPLASGERAHQFVGLRHRVRPGVREFPVRQKPVPSHERGRSMRSVQRCQRHRGGQVKRGAGCFEHDADGPALVPAEPDG